MVPKSEKISVSDSTNVCVVNNGYDNLNSDSPGGSVNISIL